MVNEVKRRPEPTRDVYVTRTTDGEREFVGFGRESDQFADCHIDPDTLPSDKIKVSVIVKTTKEAVGDVFVHVGGTGTRVRHIGSGLRRYWRGSETCRQSGKR